MKWKMLKNKIRRRKMKDEKLVEIRKGEEGENVKE